VTLTLSDSYFGMTAVECSAFTAISVCHKSGSGHFSSMYCT